MDTLTIDRPRDRAKRTRSAAAEVKTINLALQGGGAHGAFTWGVLDRLLEDEPISFEGVSATSAGAMNAAVLAYGLGEGGREGAKKALSRFWLRVSHAAAMGPLQPSMIDRALHNHAVEHSPAFVVLDFMTRVFSPYQLNPANLNPLQHVLEQSVDFRRLRERSPVNRSLKRMNIHAIAADAVMQKLSVMSKLNANWEFLMHLRDDGREFASHWLTENFDRVGLESTIDVHERYL